MRDEDIEDAQLSSSNLHERCEIDQS